MKINPLVQRTQQLIISSSNNPVSEKYSTQIPNVTKNLVKIALPIIAIVALINMPSIDAAPTNINGVPIGCLEECKDLGFLACWSRCIPFNFDVFFP